MQRVTSVEILSPVYTIQPVVKPVVKHSTGCQTRLTTGCIVYTARCQTSCTTRFDNRLNEQRLFVQHGCQTGLYNPVVSCKRGTSRPLHSRRYIAPCQWSVVTMWISCTVSKMLPLFQCLWPPVTFRSASVWYDSWNYTSRVLSDSHSWNDWQWCHSTDQWPRDFVWRLHDGMSSHYDRQTDMAIAYAVLA